MSVDETDAANGNSSSECTIVSVYERGKMLLFTAISLRLNIQYKCTIKTHKIF